MITYHHSFKYAPAAFVFGLLNATHSYTLLLRLSWLTCLLVWYVYIFTHLPFFSCFFFSLPFLLFSFISTLSSSHLSWPESLPIIKSGSNWESRWRKRLFLLSLLFSIHFFCPNFSFWTLSAFFSLCSLNPPTCFAESWVPTLVWLPWKQQYENSKKKKKKGERDKGSFGWD